MGRKAAAATTGDLTFNPFSKCRSGGHVCKIIGFKLKHCQISIGYWVQYSVTSLINILASLRRDRDRDRSIGFRLVKASKIFCP